MSRCSDSSSSDLAKKEAEVERILGVRFLKIREESKPYDELITIDTDVDYSNLLRGVQDILWKKESVYGSPYLHSHSETIRTLFVEPVLCDVLFYVKRKNGLKTFTNEVQLVPELSIKEIEKTGKIIADYATIFDPAEVRVKGVGSGDNYVPIVEVKNGKATEGLPQCFLAMKSCFDSKEEQKLVYGVVTDGADWILCSYAGDKAFQISNAILVMKGISRSDWMIGDGPAMIQILHTIFDLQIQDILGIDESNVDDEVVQIQVEYEVEYEEAEIQGESEEVFEN